MYAHVWPFVLLVTIEMALTHAGTNTTATVSDRPPSGHTNTVVLASTQSSAVPSKMFVQKAGPVASGEKTPARWSDGALFLRQDKPKVSFLPWLQEVPGSPGIMVIRRPKK